MKGGTSPGSTAGPLLEHPNDLRPQTEDSKQKTEENNLGFGGKQAYIRNSSIHHASSGGFASAPVCSRVCGAGENRPGEGGEAVRSRVPQSCRLHLRRLALEEIPHRVRHGW